MKIAQITPSFPPHPGGMGYVCLNYSLELARLGHDVTVFAVDRPANRTDKRSWPFKLEFIEPVMRYGDGGVIPGLVSRLGSFDIAQLHFPFYGGSEFVYLASKLRNQRYAVTYHMDCRGNTLLKRMIMAVYEPVLNRFLLRNAALITSPGPAFLASARFKHLVPAARVASMTHAGVDTTLFKPAPRREDLVAKHKLAGRTVGLFVGNPQPFKGLQLLIDAVARFNHPDFSLLIVGGGYDEAYCRSHVDRKGLADRVIFAGSQTPHGDLPAYYNLADFLILPSTYSESYGLVVLEAMSSGIPAIVSNLPGPAQLVDNGRDSLLFDVGSIDQLVDRLALLCSDAPLRRQMGAAARAKVEKHYSWTIVGRQLESALQNAVDLSENHAQVRCP